MELKTAIEHALDGYAILFAGAGFSIGARNAHNSKLKTGDGLKKYLANQLSISDTLPLEEVSDDFANVFGEEKLVTTIKEQCSSKLVEPFHVEIASIPWKRIYTTNYDDVIEKASLENSTLVDSVVLSDSTKRISSNKQTCVHLNGYVQNLTVDNLWSELKLTETSYLEGAINDSSWAVLLRQDLAAAKSVFFIGYSGYDLDIRRILFEHGELKNKCSFILGPTPDELTIRRASRFGSILKISAEDFSKKVNEVKKDYKPQEREFFLGSCLEKIENLQDKKEFSDEYVFDILLNGKYSLGHIWNSIHGGPDYYCLRKTVDKILFQFSGGKKIISINSELGNGKTLILEGLKCRAIENGYDVFKITKYSDTIFQEIEDAIRSSHKKTLLIIDNYPDYLDVIEKLHLYLSDTLYIALSARTSAHESLIDQVCKMLKYDDIPEYNVDKLEEEELSWVASYFDQYGLWGEKASWDHKRKIKYLQYECKSEFQGILINLFDSPQIQKKFKLLFTQLENKKDYYEVTICILILAVLNQLYEVNRIFDIWGDLISGTRFRRNPVISEMLDFEKGTFKLRSSVAAEFILKKVADTKTTVDVLTKMAISVDKFASESKYHRSLFKTLMRFSSLQYVLPDKLQRAAAIRYYESIKNLNGAKSNPLFWLQYAISCLVFGEYERAEKYFQEAYSFANKRGYETFQIDNHYARYLIENAIINRDKDRALASFRVAHKIISEQVRRERLHYPYRVARSYFKFFEKYQDEFSGKEKEEIYRAAEFIKSKIKQLPEHIQKQRYVSECDVNMDLILEKR